jgi:hypothetical protein
MTATALDTNLVPSPPPELDVKFVLPDTPEGTVDCWVAEDSQFDESEWRTVEEMEEDLLEAIDFTLSPEEARRIVAQHAPNAPHRECVAPKVPNTNIAPNANVTPTANVKPTPNVKPPYPPELEPLIQSGVVFLKWGVWSINKCFNCGKVGDICGHRFNYEVNAVGPMNQLTGEAQLPLGTATGTTIPSPMSGWWNSFKGADELEGSGSVKMYVENFLPEGITLICGLPKEGKSWLALSVAKALTTGQPLFGKVGYEVPEPVPVLYLAAESGDGALKLRCDRMKITKDKKMFLARTLSQGLMPTLDSPIIEEAIKNLRPVVILETLIRFNDGTDEDSSTENRKLAEALFRLIALGAKAVVGIHHSRKDLDKKRPTKEMAVRGSDDGLAMVDAVWLVMQDSQLHQGGKGPNEVDVVGWGRDFTPAPIRLALTRKNTEADQFEFSTGIVSCIDRSGDLVWVQKSQKLDSDAPAASTDQIDKDVQRLVTEIPTISRKELIEQTGYTEKRVKNALKRLGYSRKAGDAKATRWVQSVGPFVGPVGPFLASSDPTRMNTTT